MKRGQIEIIGLLVIIILLSIAVIIALRFLLKEPSQSLEKQRESIKATALMNVLFSTNTNYMSNLGALTGPLDYSTRNKQIRDIITDCVNNDCSEEQEIIDSILNRIINNKKYFLIIKDKNGNELMHITDQSSACLPNSIDVITSNGLVKNDPEIRYNFGLC